MDYEIELRYQKLNKHLEKTFGDDLDVHALLFLIGVNELGKGHNKYSKQEKTDLIHIAICTLLTPAGYYEYKGRDEDGWPHFELLSNLPPINSKEQEHLIKEAMLDYFIEHQYYTE
tara:strand:- start:452 stop:799 length:348 start_codon:yes stop_codon:yes gene_type:complete